MNKNYKRSVGYMKPLTRKGINLRILVFDTETYIVNTGLNTEKYPLRLGAAIYFEFTRDGKIKNNINYRFKTVDEFIDILDEHKKNKQKLYVMAHNIGFDIRVMNLPEKLYELGYLSEPPIINERIFMWTVNKDKHSIAFIDTANFGVLSVFDLGKQLGLDKGQVNFRTENDDELYEYCLRDTQIIELFMQKYLSYLYENNLGVFRLTLASQSLTAFRTSFMDNKPYLHNNQYALELERKAYHGGRAECFQIGEIGLDAIYYLDVNSMYPYCMKEYEYPCELFNVITKASVNRLKLWLKQYYVIAKVTVKTDKAAYPYLLNNKLVFPVGEFTTELHQSELEYAVKHGHILDIHSVLLYTKTRYFESYVDFFYSTKVTAENMDDKAWRYISKLFMNSLYGKFGERKHHRMLIDKSDDIKVFRMSGFDIDNRIKYAEIGWYGTLYREWQDGETYNSCPAIAGAVTAYARMVLWNYIEIAGLKNVFYIDTDSLIINERGLFNLVSYMDNQILGMLKLEKVSKIIHIYGCKDYAFGSDEKTKGVPIKAEKIDIDRWTYLQFEGFNTWLNKGGIGEPVSTQIVKRRRSVYNKGIIQENGRVIPFVLSLV